MHKSNSSMIEKENRSNIRELNMDGIDKYNISISYTDDDIIIIDDLRDLPITDKPLRPNMNIIIMCMEGKIQLEINGKTFTVTKNEILVCSPNIILDNCMVSNNSEAKILCLTNKVIQESLHANVDIWNRAIYINRQNIIELKDEEIVLFQHYYGLIKAKMQQEGGVYKKAIMQSILQAALFEFCEKLTRETDNEETKVITQGNLLFKKFIDLLSSNRGKKRKVYYYAECLFVTPKYLSSVCKEISGKTAMEWIQEYMEEDIRYYLKSSNMSIKEIAEELDFPNLSFFGKYVRTHFGMSPKAYRTHINEQSKETH